ncbi:Vitamin B12 transporter BtuB [Brevundimonas sp. NIBR10]|uniref:TonB-dependent receptor plug domain-containing protein n=1 Tax=Brevundimonas sp. NIBR10 TaxID=3015997 RepID=UPI0022F1B6D4|nr:TonB-dependent receptor [Brevundimonas sp. NIBR10]WGM45879.1 Vitamin B12 transporter BtuB [Brevundimonas sp. NIBR10]
MRHFLGAAVLAGAALTGASAWAQQGDPVRPAQTRDAESSDDQVDAVDEVVVTGSLIRGLPREYVASPLFSHGREEIEGSGAPSLGQYILSIPQNFTGDLSEFATTAAGIGSPLGDATTYNQFDAFAGFALRGLASDATLTLLNGRRMASVGMTEAPTVSVLPSALIERIDIIPDGASATYGADAVAGVVNIVTRRPKDGLELRVRGATSTRTGKTDLEASALGGRSWGSGSAYAMAMIQDRTPFIDTPVEVNGSDYQITQLPDERLTGLYAGVEQHAGDFTFTVDASRFDRDRESRQYFLDAPASDRLYQSSTDGYAIYSGVNWRGSRRSSVDLTVDYSENFTQSRLTRPNRPTLAPSVRDYTNTLLVAELRGQTTLLTLPGGPVLVAGGVQHREETLSTNAPVFFGRDGGEREVDSVFGELNVPVISRDQAIPWVQGLTLSAAARYEDLGFDTALAPKVGMRWQVNDVIALRGTWARSFLVPRFRDTIGISEQVSFWSEPYAFLNPSDQNPLVPTGDAVIMYRAGANPDLKTQNAETFTLGFDLTPSFLPGLEVRAGYYNIRISDRVGTPTPEDSLSVADLQVFNVVNPTLAQVQAILQNPVVTQRFAVDVPFYNNGRYYNFPNAAAVPTSLLSQIQLIADIRSQNFAEEATDGLDLDVRYDTELLGGPLRVKFTAQYILSLELTAGGGTVVSRLGGYAKPADLKLNGSVVWGRDGVSVGSVINYVDAITDDRPGEPVREINPYTTASLFLGFDLGRVTSRPWLDGSELQIVVANVFDQQPSTVVDGVLGYDPFNNPPNPRTVGLILTSTF